MKVMEGTMHAGGGVESRIGMGSSPPSVPTRETSTRKSKAGSTKSKSELSSEDAAPLISDLHQKKSKKDSAKTKAARSPLPEPVESTIPDNADSTTSVPTRKKKSKKGSTKTKSTVLLSSSQPPPILDVGDNSDGDVHDYVNTSTLNGGNAVDDPANIADSLISSAAANPTEDISAELAQLMGMEVHTVDLYGITESVRCMQSVLWARRVC